MKLHYISFNQQNSKLSFTMWERNPTTALRFEKLAHKRLIEENNFCNSPSKNPKLWNLHGVQKKLQTVLQQRKLRSQQKCLLRNGVWLHTTLPKHWKGWMINDPATKKSHQHFFIYTNNLNTNEQTLIRWNIAREK